MKSLTTLTSLALLCACFAQNTPESQYEGVPRDVGADLLAAYQMVTGDSVNANQDVVAMINKIAPVTSYGSILPTKSGLSADCSNKLCNMMQYALSCKTMNVGFKRICATYFLGSIYGCSMFPSAAEVYDAPSICLTEFVTFLTTLLTGGQTALMNIVMPYLTNDFEENACGRRCYQYYQTYSNEFYENCFDEFTNPTTGPTIQTTYAVAYGISNFQEFRNQACTYNPENGQNCYVTFTNATNNPNSQIDVMNQYCNYVGISSTTYNAQQEAQNTYAMKSICSMFSAFGCCAANGISMVQQGQTSTTDLNIFPPCLLRFFTNNCSTIDLQNYCANGSIANLATMTGQVTIPKTTGGKAPFPNMYNQTSVLTLQGVISAVLQNLLGMGVEPYNFNSVSGPLQVQIISYEYLDADGFALTPTNGTMYWPPGGDYSAASSGRFMYQLVMQNLNSTEVAKAFAALTSFNFQGGMSMAYTGVFGTAVAVQSFDNALFEADPLVLPPNSAWSAFSHSWMSTVLVTLSASIVLVVSSWRQ